MLQKDDTGCLLRVNAHAIVGDAGASGGADFKLTDKQTTNTERTNRKRKANAKHTNKDDAHTTLISDQHTATIIEQT